MTLCSIGGCSVGACRSHISPECHVEAGAARWDPRIHAVEFFGSQNDDGDNGCVGSQGDCADTFFECAAAEDGIGAFCDAAFGEDPDDFAFADELDAAADSGEGVPETVNWKCAALIEGCCTPPGFVELNAGHPANSATDGTADDEWFEMADVGAGEEEAAWAINALVVERDLADALELDEIAGEAAGLVERDAHLRIRLSCGQSHGVGMVSAG